MGTEYGTCYCYRCCYYCRSAVAVAATVAAAFVAVAATVAADVTTEHVVQCHHVRLNIRAQLSLPSRSTQTSEHDGGFTKSIFAERLLSNGAILIKFCHSNSMVTCDKL